MIAGGKRKYEEAVEEGRGAKVLKSKSLKVPRFKGQRVQSHELYSKEDPSCAALNVPSNRSLVFCTAILVFGWQF